MKRRKGTPPAPKAEAPPAPPAEAPPPPAAEASPAPVPPIPNDTIVSSSDRFEVRIVSLPTGSFYHPDGTLWPFYPDDRVILKTKKFHQEIRKIIRSETDDTPKGGKKPLAIWAEIVEPHFDPLVESNGPFPSLGEARTAVRRLLKARKKAVPHNRTIERWLNDHHPRWFVRTRNADATKGSK